MAPELSVIVITHNRRELLRGCLESLGRQTAPPDAYEVVVVVDGSTDGTAQILAELSPPFRLSVFVQPQAGPSAARNAGAARAVGRILLFIDDDEEASPTHVAAHLQAHRAREGIAALGVIEGRLPAGADRFVLLRAEAARLHYEQLGARPVTYQDCYTGNCSVLRSTFDEVGGFAADLPREEDAEFAYRLQEAGVEFVFLPESGVSHYQTHDWKQIVSNLELSGRIAVELYRRHPAMVTTMELGGHYSTGLSRTWIWLRAVLLALHVPPRALARFGFLVPRQSWARTWFRFVRHYCYWCGVRAAGDRELWRRTRRGTLILLYHAFGDAREQPSPYVVPGRRFARQMAWLKRRGYNVISLSEYMDCRREHSLPPAKSVVITMDGGYVDNDTIARPILEGLGFTATVFLVTSVDARENTADPMIASRPLIDPARARSILGGAIEFGAHTRTHPDLTVLATTDAEEEVLGSKQDLERVLGVPVTGFAYPYGAVTPEVRNIVRHAGFWSACGVTPGHNRAATDAFDLRRTNVSGSYTLLRFAATLLIGDTRRFGLRRPCRWKRTVSGSHRSTWQGWSRALHRLSYPARRPTAR